MQAGERESGAAVVKGRVHPVGGVVAGVASLREVCRDVVRIRRALIVLQVASHAGRTVQVVVVVDVAIRTGARRHGVHAGQRESRGGVVKGRIHPVGGVMALIASLRKVCRDVVGIRRCLIVL